MPTLTQTIEHGQPLVIGGKKFTVDLSSASDTTVYLKGQRGGYFFLRFFLNARHRYEVISLSGGAGGPVRNKFHQPLRATITDGVLTDLTGK